MVIGYYVHHRGSGHLHRALAIADELHDEVVILSSASRAAGWTGRWIELPLDTDLPPVSATAGGALHWAPVGSDGLAKRMSLISEWIVASRPRVVIVDVSVEVTALVRLHGVRVVVVAQPGRRDDPAHSLAYSLADAVIGCWPEIVRPVDTADSVRIDAVGGLSRIQAGQSGARTNTICVVSGTGGRGRSALADVVASAQRAMPDREWVTVSGQSEEAVAAALRSASVAFAHCGQNVVAEIAAARVPAVFVAEDRPFDEQRHLAATLAALDLPLRVVEPTDSVDWSDVVSELESDPGTAWGLWVDGSAPRRAAAVIERVASAGSAA